MGFDFRAKAVIGLEIDEEILSKEVETKIGNHNFDSKTKFHPETGQRLWGTKTKHIDGYDPEDETLLDYKIIRHGYGEYTGKVYVVGFAAETGSSNGGNVVAFTSIGLPSANEVKTLREQMKADLSPLGLWDEKKFGLWSLLCGG